MVMQCPASFNAPSILSYSMIHFCIVAVLACTLLKPLSVDPLYTLQRSWNYAAMKKVSNMTEIHFIRTKIKLTLYARIRPLVTHRKLIVAGVQMGFDSGPMVITALYYAAARFLSLVSSCLKLTHSSSVC